MPLYEVSVAYLESGEAQHSHACKSVSVVSKEAIDLVIAKAVQWNVGEHRPKIITVREYDEQLNQVDEVASYQAN